MVIHEIEQRSPEWFAIRRKFITASEVGMFIVNTDKKAMDARTNLIHKKLGQIADGDDTEPQYENYWMKRGTLLEPESICAYEQQSGESTRHVGFINHETLAIGCSPDAIFIDKPGGIEGKAVSGKVQIGRLKDNILPPEYTCQIHHSMIVTDAPYWDFWSYHPALPRFLVRTFRDDFTKRFEEGLQAFCEKLTEEREWIKNLWTEKFPTPQTNANL